MGLHEPTVPDLLQAIAELKEREHGHIEMIRGYDKRIERQAKKITELTDTIHRLETELAEAWAKGEK